MDAASERAQLPDLHDQRSPATSISGGRGLAGFRVHRTSYQRGRAGTLGYGLPAGAYWDSAPGLITLAATLQALFPGVK